MNIIVIGPPGAGKGTQAILLSKEFNAAHISTGDLLREEIKKHSTIGEKVHDFLEHGDLVPDTTILSIVENRIIKDDARKGFILDGFPRTVEQAQKLDAVLQKYNKKIHIIIDYNLSDTSVSQRIHSRAIADKKAGKKVREDDLNEETIQNRIKTYHQRTEPLLQYYKDKIIVINAEQSIEEIFKETCNKINA